MLSLGDLLVPSSLSILQQQLQEFSTNNNTIQPVANIQCTNKKGQTHTQTPSLYSQPINTLLNESLLTLSSITSSRSSTTDMSSTTSTTQYPTPPISNYLPPCDLSILQQILQWTHPYIHDGRSGGIYAERAALQLTYGLQQDTYLSNGITSTSIPMIIAKGTIPEALPLLPGNICMDIPNMIPLQYARQLTYEDWLYHDAYTLHSSYHTYHTIKYFTADNIPYILYTDGIHNERMNIGLLHYKHNNTNTSLYITPISSIDIGNRIHQIEIMNITNKLSTRTQLSPSSKSTSNTITTEVFIVAIRCQGYICVSQLTFGPALIGHANKKRLNLTIQIIDKLLFPNQDHYDTKPNTIESGNNIDQLLTYCNWIPNVNNSLPSLWMITQCGNIYEWIGKEEQTVTSPVQVSLTTDKFYCRIRIMDILQDIPTVSLSSNTLPIPSPLPGYESNTNLYTLVRRLFGLEESILNRYRTSLNTSPGTSTLPPNNSTSSNLNFEDIHTKYLVNRTRLDMMPYFIDDKASLIYSNYNTHKLSTLPFWSCGTFTYSSLQGIYMVQNDCIHIFYHSELLNHNPNSLTNFQYRQFLIHNFPPPNKWCEQFGGCLGLHDNTSPLHTMDHIYAIQSGRTIYQLPSLSTSSTILPIISQRILFLISRSRIFVIDLLSPETPLLHVDHLLYQYPPTLISTFCTFASDTKVQIQGFLTSPVGKKTVTLQIEINLNSVYPSYRARPSAEENSNTIPTNIPPLQALITVHPYIATNFSPEYIPSVDNIYFTGHTAVPHSLLTNQKIGTTDSWIFLQSVSCGGVVAHCLSPSSASTNLSLQWALHPSHQTAAAVRKNLFHNQVNPSITLNIHPPILALPHDQQYSGLHTIGEEDIILSDSEDEDTGSTNTSNVSNQIKYHPYSVANDTLENTETRTNLFTNSVLQVPIDIPSCYNTKNKYISSEDPFPIHIPLSVYQSIVLNAQDKQLYDSGKSLDSILYRLKLIDKDIYALAAITFPNYAKYIRRTLENIPPAQNIDISSSLIDGIDMPWLTNEILLQDKDACDQLSKVPVKFRKRLSVSFNTETKDIARKGTYVLAPTLLSFYDYDQLLKQYNEDDVSSAMSPYSISSMSYRRIAKLLQNLYDDRLHTMIKPIQEFFSSSSITYKDDYEGNMRVTNTANNPAHTNEATNPTYESKQEFLLSKHSTNAIYKDMEILQVAAKLPGEYYQQDLSTQGMVPVEWSINTPLEISKTILQYNRTGIIPEEMEIKDEAITRQRLIDKKKNYRSWKLQKAKQQLQTIETRIMGKETILHDIPKNITTRNPRHQNLNDSLQHISDSESIDSSSDDSSSSSSDSTTSSSYSSSSQESSVSDEIQLRTNIQTSLEYLHYTQNSLDNLAQFQQQLLHSNFTSNEPIEARNIVESCISILYRSPCTLYRLSQILRDILQDTTITEYQVAEQLSKDARINVSHISAYPLKENILPINMQLNEDRIENTTTSTRTINTIESSNSSSTLLSTVCDRHVRYILSNEIGTLLAYGVPPSASELRGGYGIWDTVWYGITKVPLANNELERTGLFHVINTISKSTKNLISTNKNTKGNKARTTGKRNQRTWDSDAEEEDTNNTHSDSSSISSLSENQPQVKYNVENNDNESLQKLHEFITSPASPLSLLDPPVRMEPYFQPFDGRYRWSVRVRADAAARYWKRRGYEGSNPFYKGNILLPEVTLSEPIEKYVTETLSKYLPFSYHGTYPLPWMKLLPQDDEGNFNRKKLKATDSTNEANINNRRVVNHKPVVLGNFASQYEAVLAVSEAYNFGYDKIIVPTTLKNNNTSSSAEISTLGMVKLFSSNNNDTTTSRNTAISDNVSRLPNQTTQSQCTCHPLVLSSSNKVVKPCTAINCIISHTTLYSLATLSSPIKMSSTSIPLDASLISSDTIMEQVYNQYLQNYQVLQQNLVNSEQNKNKESATSSSKVFTEGFHLPHRIVSQMEKKAKGKGTANTQTNIPESNENNQEEMDEDNDDFFSLLGISRPIKSVASSINQESAMSKTHNTLLNIPFPTNTTNLTSPSRFSIASKATSSILSPSSSNRYQDMYTSSSTARTKDLHATPIDTSNTALYGFIRPVSSNRFIENSISQYEMDHHYGIKIEENALQQATNLLLRKQQQQQLSSSSSDMHTFTVQPQTVIQDEWLTKLAAEWNQTNTNQDTSHTVQPSNEDIETTSILKSKTNRKDISNKRGNQNMQSPTRIGSQVHWADIEEEEEV